MTKASQGLQSAIQDLEKIVNELSSDTLDIEKGLDKFKEGVALVKFCKNQLQKAENEFKVIKKDLETNPEEEKDGNAEKRGESLV